MIQLLDDQLLSRVLCGERPPRPRDQVFTTGCWYVRLCQAVLRSSGVSVLSGPFAALPEPSREIALRAVLDLPASVGLLSLRELGPRIGQLRQRHDLNMLSIEALAAAAHMQATVFLSVSSPRLEAALRSERRRVVVLA